MQVGVGGAYYLISRSFGLGGRRDWHPALSFANSLAYTLCLWPSRVLYARHADRRRFPELDDVSLAAVIVLMVTLFAARSTELALKLQRPIMVLIFASIFSLLAGSFYSEGPADPNWITLEAPAA